MAVATVAGTKRGGFDPAHEGLAIGLFVLALLTTLSLLSYSPADYVPWLHEASADAPRQVVNYIGRVGAFFAGYAFQLSGYATFGIPVALVLMAYPLFHRQPVAITRVKIAAALVLYLTTAALLGLVPRVHMHIDNAIAIGGLLGTVVAHGMTAVVNTAGAAIILTSGWLLALVAATRVSLFDIVSHGITGAGATIRRLVDAAHARREARALEQQRIETVKGATTTPSPLPTPMGPRPTVAGGRTGDGYRRPADTLIVCPPNTPAPVPGADTRTPGRAVGPNPGIRTPTPPTGPARAQSEDGYFSLAALGPRMDSVVVDDREVLERQQLLEQKCEEFGVSGTVISAQVGPVVTTYEFKPDQGVRVAQVMGLTEDLRLAMQAESVLISPIPGRSAVGIQIPNRQRESISLWDLLESAEFKQGERQQVLPLALGRKVDGTPYVTDLAAMPHLLIAGATGQGKSVGINTMLTSILYQRSPKQVRFIMIDPKRLELGMYEGIPHLLAPVVVEPKQAANALRWAVGEMEARYKTLAAAGVRSLEQYNRNVDAGKVEVPEGATPAETLPCIVVLIDELADLMMVAGKEVEQSICRLAQMARAVGIHLILATQRPSVDVITGIIKANMPSRIAFRVSSKVDARTVLDQNGAEQLLGKGDMLFMAPATSHLVRLHGAYISEQQTRNIVNQLKLLGKPQYNDAVVADERRAPNGEAEREKDDLYDEAVRMVVKSQKASISALQRSLGIGFSRAGRLIDMMEQDGLVSAETRGKREVLVPSDYFAGVDAQLR